MKRFARGFLRNFTVVLLAYIAFLKFQNENYILGVLLFLAAVLIAYINYRLAQKENKLPNHPQDQEEN